ncbi:MAG: aminotransferase class III-fold pyridoxal phosphate-dependent enzyme [Pararhodobacter sp.]|nr:aminotransferase class III-fold pyridoxal phosphate-dependent enzyme [Pararhodobacter sp.]
MPAPNTAIDSALADAIERYTQNNPKSRDQHESAMRFLPGGNTRTVLFYEPFPITLVSGEGAYVTSLDGVRYVDFLGEYTAGLFGHSDPVIRQAIDRALDGGIVLGGHTENEARLAEALSLRFPSLERLRFTNSGTEANLMAMSTARAVTGREKIMVFEGAYHGGVFTFAGESPLNAPFDFIRATYNDAEQALALASEHGDALAAIVVEPMLGAGGCIPAERPFLAALREAADRHGAILIFDEVMTSRLSPGGLQAVHEITPDMTTLGKYIGGGLTIGAFGGRGDIMGRFDPHQPGAFSHAGTFNNNILTMSAGLVAMTKVYTPQAATALTERGESLRGRLNAMARKAGAAMQFTGYGSLMTVHMHGNAIRTPQEAAKGSKPLRDLFFFDLLDHGIWLSRRGMINVSLPMGEAECAQLEAAVEEFVASRATLLA